MKYEREKDNTNLTSNKKFERKGKKPPTNAVIWINYLF